jgi:hypothetical protein
MHGLIFETSICYWQDQPGSFFGLCSERTLEIPREQYSNAITKRHKIASVFEALIILGVVYIYPEQ